MIGWLTCKWKGHLRGKFVRQDGNKRITHCPRCKREIARTVKSSTEATA